MKSKTRPRHTLNRYRYLLALCLGFVGIAPPFARAQPPADPEAVVTLRFSMLSLGGTLRELYFDGSEGSEAVTVTNASRTASTQYTGSPLLQFYRLGEPVEGVRERLPFASVDLTGRSGELLLLFIPKGGSGASENPAHAARIVALDDSADNFPAGSWCLYNLTSFPLAIAAQGEEPRRIDGGQHFVYEIDGNRPETKRIEIAIYKEEGWQRVYRSMWSYRADTRSLVFLMPKGDGQDRISVRRYTDRVEAAGAPR